MKVVLDTNILISALVFGGKPRAILEMILFGKKVIGITSLKLTHELLGVLRDKFVYSQTELSKIEKLIKHNFVIVDPKFVPNIIKEDPFDNNVLAIVHEMKINFIISGDNHLLNVKHYKNIPIVTPHGFLRMASNNT